MRKLTIAILFCSFALSFLGQDVSVSASAPQPGIPQIRLADLPGPELIKLPRRQHDGVPQWRLDMAKRLEAMEGGDGIFVCKYPDCMCRILAHAILCCATSSFDCGLHVFQPCMWIEYLPN